MIGQTFTYKSDCDPLHLLIRIQSVSIMPARELIDMAL